MSDLQRVMPAEGGEFPGVYGAAPIPTSELLIGGASESSAAGPDPAIRRVREVIRAFNALTAHEQHLVADRLSMIMSAGSPPPPFTTAMAEARDWAAWAGTDELKAYLVASFLAMPKRERQTALRHLTGRADS